MEYDTWNKTWQGKIAKEICDLVQLQTRNFTSDGGGFCFGYVIAHEIICKHAPKPAEPPVVIEGPCDLEPGDYFVDCKYRLEAVHVRETPREHPNTSYGFHLNEGDRAIKLTLPTFSPREPARPKEPRMFKAHTPLLTGDNCSWFVEWEDGTITNRRNGNFGYWKHMSYFNECGWKEIK